MVQVQGASAWCKWTVQVHGASAWCKCMVQVDAYGAWEWGLGGWMEVGMEEVGGQKSLAEVIGDNSLLEGDNNAQRELPSAKRRRGGLLG